MSFDLQEAWSLNQARVQLIIIPSNLIKPSVQRTAAPCTPSPIPPPPLHPAVAESKIIPTLPVSPCDSFHPPLLDIFRAGMRRALVALSPSTVGSSARCSLIWSRGLAPASCRSLPETRVCVEI